jgi:cation:H+ antiporter
MPQLVLLLLVGFFVLIKGADWLVDGGVLVAKKLRVSPLIIGLTIVAFGTSAPELIVNIISSLSEDGSGIGLGNIIGSNIANIGLIISIAAIIYPLTIKASTIAREIPLMILSAILFLALLSDRFLNQADANILSRTDGVVMLLFFTGFLYYLINTAVAQRRSRSSKSFELEFDDHQTKQVSLLKGIVLLLVGLIGILIGGKLVVDNAVDIARVLGVSEILIGLTIIAVGTSLPELTTAIIA